MGVRRLGVRMITVDTVMSNAKQVKGMVPFFSLLGAAITSGRMKRAYYALVNEIGLSPERAYTIIDRWKRSVRLANDTGWTAEAAAIGFVINDVPAWREIDWLNLMGVLR